MSDPVIDLGVELNGYTDRDGNPDNQPRDDDERNRW